MKYLSEKEFNAKMKRIKAENLTKKRKAQLKEERKKGKPQKKVFSTSKIVLIGMILICVEIVLFCEYAMLKLMDTSSMYVLIGIPVALAPIIWGYYSKSKAENTSGGIVYETAMAQLDIENSQTNSEESSSSDAQG
mgnify:FL=1|jgi:hypothetical protein